MRVIPEERAKEASCRAYGHNARTLGPREMGVNAEREREVPQKVCCKLDLTAFG